MSPFTVSFIILLTFLGHALQDLGLICCVFFLRQLALIGLAYDYAWVVFLPLAILIFYALLELLHWAFPPPR